VNLSDAAPKGLSPMVYKLNRNHMSTTARIGGGGGFWGDQTLAPLALIEQGELDYLTIDYLSEVTMSIMHKQLVRDAEAGWATDLADWLKAGGIGMLHSMNVKLVTNAGGANPRACASMVLSAAAEIGWNDCVVALVIGDDISSRLSGVGATGAELEHMFDASKGSLLDHTERVVSANAYLGAGPIARALERGADIVITGRVADASLIVGCMLHHQGWAKNAESQNLPLCGPISKWHNDENTLDIIAGWTIAGHLIECGAQVTGGNSSDWLEIDNLATIGYPIAEIGADGHCIITKPLLSGGAVTPRIVSEQLLYEIGDPSSYITPDCTIDLRSITLEQITPDRVLVQGAIGIKPPETLKVSATHRDGWMAAAELAVPGPKPRMKAERLNQVLKERLEHCKGLNIHCEFLGDGALLPPNLRIDSSPPSEIIVRWVATSHDKMELAEFARSIAPLVLTGPAGVCGYGARARPRELLRFFPTSIGRVLIEPQVHVRMLHSWRHELELRMPWLEEHIFDRLEDMVATQGVKSRLAGRVLKRLERVKEGETIHD
jgi:hypothetical protein